MKKLVILINLLALVGSTLACKTLLPGSSQGQYNSVCREALAGLNALTENLEFPKHFQQEHPLKLGGEFDPNRYFDVLTHLKMQEGFTLDYVYQFQGIGGQPLLYARPLEQAPYPTDGEFSAAKPASYLSAVVADDTPQGFLQLAILGVKGSQFYRYWHAGYNDQRILCGSADIEQIIRENETSDFGMKMDLAQKIKARAISQPDPQVTITANRVTVNLVMFTNWGGFYRRTYTINRAFPHSILDVQNETLVEYDCGIMF